MLFSEVVPVYILCCYPARRCCAASTSMYCVGLIAIDHAMNSLCTSYLKLYPTLSSQPCPIANVQLPQIIDRLIASLADPTCVMIGSSFALITADIMLAASKPRGRLDEPPYLVVQHLILAIKIPLLR
jgi:hypothetical protein